MNFFDAAYEAPVSSPTPPPQASGSSSSPSSSSSTQQQQPSFEESLNQEVSEVMGQLGKFWGGFRKQSQSALEAARKDIGGYVAQAQQELNKLTVSESTPTSSTTTTSTTDTTREATSDSTDPEASSSTAGPSTSTSSSTSTLPAPVPDSSSSSSDATPSSPPLPTSPTSSLFSRLQSSIPPTFIQKVQQNLPAHVPLERVDLAHLRTAISDLSTDLQEELQRVRQSSVVNVATEEGREFLRGASEFLREAVRVVPPDEGQQVEGVMWDGMDVWTIPATVAASSSPSSSNVEASTTTAKTTKAGEVTAIATRKEAILRTLRTNPDILRVDPRADERTKAVFEEWERTEVEGLEGGVKGEKWVERMQGELEVDMEALTRTRDVLTSEEEGQPAALTEDEFWTRYFFRKHQIEQDEARRKALLEGSIEQEEDIAWEDDDEESTTESQAKPTSTTPQATQSQSLTVETPGNTTPRESSEESYDMLSSSRTSNVGDTTTTTVAPVKKEKEEKEEGEEEDSGSDWE